MNLYQHNRQQPIHANRQARGLSLVELMVAITLGMLLTAGILTLFNTSKTTFNTNEALSRTQENGRFALEILKREIRETGTHGWCAGRVTITDHVDACDSFPNGADSPLIGWEFAGTADGDAFTVSDDLDPGTASAGSWSTASGGGLHPGLNGQLSPGSDFFIFRRFEPSGLVADTTSLGGDTITLTGPQIGDVIGDVVFPRADSLMMVSNCSFSDIFRQNGAGSLNKGGSFCPGAPTQAWSTAYGQGAQIFQLQEIAYFVGFDPLRGNDGVPGLWRLNLSTGAREELVEGVENLQVRYGYSRDASQGGDGQSVRNESDWLTADQVPNWNQVIALRLSMSVRSAEIGDGDRTAQVFALAGSIVTVPADGRLRQPFSTTIALRNQMIVP